MTKKKRCQDLSKKTEKVDRPQDYHNSIKQKNKVI